jgi:hypothetical protein
MSNGMDGTADMLWNGSDVDGNDKVSVRTMKALPVKMKTVTLIGKGRWNLTSFVYWLHAIYNKICIYIFFFKVILDFKKYIFPWQTCFIWGGRLRLESSSICINTVYSASAYKSHKWQDVFPVLFL